MKLTHVLALGTLLFQGNFTHADWPWFLGANHDLHAPAGETIKADFAGKPTWSVPVGEGFSGPVTKDGKVFLHSRAPSEESLVCLDLTTGKQIWKSVWASQYEDNFGRGNGPRSSPCCFGEGIICLGPQGLLKAFNLVDGKPLWEKDLTATYSPGPNFFGVGYSPMVVGGKLWLNVGGAEAGIVALDPATSKELHRIAGQKSSYVTPIAWGDPKQPQVAMITREGFSLIDSQNAQVIHKFPYRSRFEASVTAASPVRMGEECLFLSSCYGTGALALSSPRAGAKTLWKNDESLSSHFGTPVYHEGFLYGFHGRQEEGALLRAVDAKTGKVSWEKEGLGTGWTMIAGKDLVVIGEGGALLIGPASSAEFKPRVNETPFTSPVRAAPAWDQGFLLVRDAKSLHGFKCK